MGTINRNDEVAPPVDQTYPTSLVPFITFFIIMGSAITWQLWPQPKPILEKPELPVETPKVVVEAPKPFTYGWSLIQPTELPEGIQIDQQPDRVVVQIPITYPPGTTGIFNCQIHLVLQGPSGPTTQSLELGNLKLGPSNLLRLDLKLNPGYQLTSVTAASYSYSRSPKT